MLTNKWIMGQGGAGDALDIRREVFSGEQGFPEQSMTDVFDAQAMHLVLYDGDIPVGAGRVWFDGKTFRIGWAAIKKEFRGQGLGDLLIKLLLLKAFEFSPSQVRLIAQPSLAKFYERYGFARDGEEFMEDGVPHIPMAVTKETLVFKSKCGHDKTFYDFFEEAKAEK